MPKPLHGAMLALAALFATSALAQSPDAPLRSRDSDPVLPGPNEQIPEKIRPSDEGTNGSGSSGDTLSDKLGRSDGVIRPPENVDPEIRTVPPESNASEMPVIKPPGNAK